MAMARRKWTLVVARRVGLGAFGSGVRRRREVGGTGDSLLRDEDPPVQLEHVVVELVPCHPGDAGVRLNIRNEGRRRDEVAIAVAHGATDVGGLVRRRIEVLRAGEVISKAHDR